MIDEGGGSMTERGWHHNWLRNAVGYVLVATLAVVLLVRLMHLKDADLTVPLANTRDAIYVNMVARTILDHGWYLYNPHLGMPFGAELHDFPQAEGLNFGLLKLLGLCGCNYAAAVNLYFLLSFPLTALTAYFVLRRFGCGRLTALVACLLFAFLPYHFWRRTRHLFLAAYFLVPLMVMLALWVYREPSLLFIQKDGAGRPRFTVFSWRVLAGVAIGLLMASGGVYYAFFGCFFLAVAGLCRAAVVRCFQPLWSAGFFICVIIVGGLINYAPNLIYTYQHGSNDQVANRNSFEAELYSLRLMQLILPVPGHRLQPLRELRERYDSSPLGLLNHEGQGASLGLIGSAGFLLLVARLFYRRPLTVAPELEEGLVVLNGSGLFLATLGGFGSLFALTVTPSIRAYGRISIYLGFFALFAVALLLDKLYRRYGRRFWGRWTLRLTLLCLLALGLYDQAPTGLFGAVALKEMAQTQYPIDVAFVQVIEARLPEGAMVFQLPYFPFPEATPMSGTLQTYDHLRAYLVSNSLRWSYGAMRGREADLWQENVSSMPLKEMVPTLYYAGFLGIYIARDGYADGGQKLEADLRNLLGTEPLQSGDGKMLFFELGAYGKALSTGLNVAELERKRDLALQPSLLIKWSKDFSGEETSPTSHCRWCCAPRGELTIINQSSLPLEVVVRLRIAVGAVSPAMVNIDSPQGHQELPADGAIHEARLLRFTVPPGATGIHLSYGGPALRSGGDPRELYFLVKDYEVKEAPLSQGAEPPQSN
jgi:phosphoglycerol transferase